jgi:hypothetical protein
LTVEAELADGRILEFPDGTDPAVIQMTVKKVMGASTKPPDATAGDRGMAAVTGVNRGLAGLAGLPVDTVENVLNLGIAGYGTAKQALTGQPGPDLLKGSLGGSESIANLMNRGGVETANPRPDDALSRIAHTGGVIAGGSVLPGARPVQTAASALTGALAAEGANQAGLPNADQYAGVGASIPGATVQGAQAVKQAISDRIAPRMEQFRQVGAEPSVGQATEFNFIQGFENLLSKFPGGQGIFRKFAEGQQENLGNAAKTGTSAEDAGRAIETGIKGFVSRSKETWKQLDAEVAAKIPQGTKFAAGNTMNALDELTAVTPGAEKTTGALINPTVAGIKKNLAEDLQANNGVLPYEALRGLRTKVGGMIEESLTSGVPQGQLKKVYGALSKDLEEAANQAGAGKEFARQNDFYKARMDRIESILERTIGKTPEETYARFFPKDNTQATTVRAVMRSLDPEQRKIVTEAAVERLGKANASKQDAAGDTFSPETFLTNWNKLSDGAKAQLFHDPVVRKNMDALANVTENIKGGAKVFANPSGTAAAAAPLGLGYLAAVGNVATVGTLAGGAMIGAKMLTSPKVVEWLAQAPKVAPEAAALHLARLGVIYNETKDEGLKEELSRFVQNVK